MSIGIVGYGGYVPRLRIRVEEIASAHGYDVHKVKNGLGLIEKSVAGFDEDVTTIAVEAARNAIARSDVASKKIGALYVGSESHVYAVKPTATTVGQVLDVNRNCMAADVEFACKGGTAALQICYGLVKADMVSYALAIGADTAQSRPGDVLEYSAASGGAAFLVGNEKDEIVATIDATISIMTDTPDFWRRSLQKYPEHTSRFSGKPSYFMHVIEATKEMLARTGFSVHDFDYVVFHQPNAKFPLEAAKQLGFSMDQLKAGFLVDRIGNAYSANSLLGLNAVLDCARPGQKILVTSYGSGSGSDVFVLTTTDLLPMVQKRALTIEDYIVDKKFLSYGQYLMIQAD